MRPDDGLTSDFETERPRLRQVAYRMLGSLDEADDAVQQAWMRAAAADRRDVENLPGWLTTVTARVCLDLLRARRRRGETPLPAHAGGGPSASGVGGRRSAGDRPPAGARAILPGVRAADGGGGRGPEDEAVMAESVGLALLVVLDRLTPAQRVAFVLHDVFAVPFEEIATVVDRSPVAAKKLASRARDRVRGAAIGRSPGGTPSSTAPAPAPAPRDAAAAPTRRDVVGQRALIDAFLAASRDGDLATLLDVLAPDVVRRADRFATPAGIAAEVRGADAVAEETKVFAARARTAEVALVDGAPGIVVAPEGRLVAVLHVTVVDGRIAEFEVVGDPARLATTTVAILPPAPASG